MRIPKPLLFNLMRLVSTLLLLLCFISSAYAERPVGEKPNVILIMADDVSWEAFSCYGAEDYKTPHIDKLAADGIQFMHCYSTPICTTSRVQLMTGKYNFRNYTHFGYLSPKEKTFGNLMKEAGYKTAIAGKWQLNGLYNELPGHKNRSRPIMAGFDEYCLWQLTKEKTKNDGERFWSPPLEMNGKMYTKKDNADKYGPDILTDFVCDYMDRNQEDPFFVYYPMVLVHNPFVPTPDTIGDAPRDHSANKQPKGKEAAKENFVAMVQYMDKLIGKIVAKVDELGLSENTIIMFTADNGTNRSITSRWNGMDIQGGKGGMTNMGTHVPFVASWKGQTPSGTKTEDLVDFTDFYPTLAAAAGISIKDEKNLDGVSFLPQLQGKPGTPRDWVFCHYQPYWNAEPGQFVRNREYKLYRTGDFYNVPNDLREENTLEPSASEKVYAELNSFLEAAPPAPTEKADKNTKERPLYPAWELFEEPGD